MESWSSHPATRRWKAGGFVLRLGICFALLYLASVAGIFFIAVPQGISLIWISNGLLLSYLLLAPRWRWPYYLAVGFAALLASGLTFHSDWRRSLLLSVLNLVEVLVGAFPLRSRSSQLPQFSQTGYVLKFLTFAVLAGPSVAGLIYSVASTALHHAFPVPDLLTWACSDGLGTAVMTPVSVAIFRSRFHWKLRWHRHWIYLLLVAITTVAAFSTIAFPLIFLIYPLLLLVLLRKGLGWAALSTLFVAAAGSWLTFHGSGPFALLAKSHSIHPGILIQLFVAAGMFMLYHVSVILEQQRAYERRLQQIVALHKLVTENSRDVILIADTKGTPTYVSPAVETMMGWSSEDMRNYATALIHPQDLPEVMEDVEESYRTGSAMSKYRLRRRDGQYVWLEASIRALKDEKTGITTGSLNILRDISERKRAEEQLQDAYRALEAMAVTDALTGLANRRRFDQYLATEWRRSLREQTPLSLLLMDVDLFKSYNDMFGHLRGDRCLKDISDVALEVVTRSGDIVARFGGEEFAAVLPNTDNEGAYLIGSEICSAVRRKRFIHPGNPGGILTVSLGCATLVPMPRQDSSALIELADRALYCAKRKGRDCVVNANTTIGAEIPALDRGPDQSDS